MKLLKAIRIEPSSPCKCSERSMQMNTWGVVGCREHRDEIVAWLRESYAELSTSEKIAAIARAAASGLALTVAGIDPVGNLVDEAIRLAEAQQGNCGNT